MLKRREFLKVAGAATAAALVSSHALATELAGDQDETLHFVSESMELQLSAVAPEFVSLNLNIDGLGKGRRGANIVDTSAPGEGFKATSSTRSRIRRVEYRPETAGANAPAVWTVELSGGRIVLTSAWSEGADSVPMVFRFNLGQVHSTVLGVFREDKLLAAPALLHFPGQGSMRLTTDATNIGLTYHSVHGKPIASLALPGATAERRRIVYTLEVTAIYPNVKGTADDARFDAFKRNWLDVLQLNPEYPSLANNTASDTCAFCYYEYGDIAALTPPLAEGLTALDIVRQTLDRILAGGHAYGLPPKPWTEFHSPFSDTFPSMLIAAGQCVRAGNSDAWLKTNYDGIKGWTETMLATDNTGNGLIKYSISGNSGIWKDGTPAFRPSNWWDTIGFGHEDAYSNALAYRALGDMVMMARKVGKIDDATRYKTAAAKLRENYYHEFYNPATGVLAGWKSADGASNVVVELPVPRINVAYDPARVRGNRNAPVMIVEFSDYQCPYCHQAEPTLEAVLAKYGEKVSFSYRDFPLRGIHDHAEIAAEAPRCALEQGKFWGYHDQLFKATILDKEALIGYAKDAKLDDKQFESCLTSEKYKAQIDKDIDEGRKAGVNGTPAFFINGIELSGVQGQDSLTRTIDDELSRKPQAPAMQSAEKSKSVTISISSAHVN